MGRRVAVLAALVMFAAGCGDDGGTAGSGDDGSDDGTAGMTEDVDGGSAEACADVQSAPPQLLPVGEVFELADNGADHVLCPSYARTPPASGPHFPAWQNCGFYTVPIQDQTAVHSLEHGAVWIAYRPDLDPGVVAEIEERMGVERHVLAAPYPGLQNPIVLTAWTRQLAVDDWNDPAVEQFLFDYTGERSSTAPEAGVTCEERIGVAPDDPDAGYADWLVRVS